MFSKRGFFCAAVVVAFFAFCTLLVPSVEAAGCEGHQHTLAQHMEWDAGLWQAESIPDWAVVKHRHYVACAKSPAHREAMRVRWERIKQSLLPENYDIWIRIGRCEQPGNGYKGINWSFDGAIYQGGLGIYSGTWDGSKPRGYPADAGQATWREQMIVANRIAAAYGFTAWGCY